MSLSDLIPSLPFQIRKKSWTLRYRRFTRSPLSMTLPLLAFATLMVFEHAWAKDTWKLVHNFWPYRDIHESSRIYLLASKIKVFSLFFFLPQTTLDPWKSRDFASKSLSAATEFPTATFGGPPSRRVGLPPTRLCGTGLRLVAVWNKVGIKEDQRISDDLMI